MDRRPIGPLPFKIMYAHCLSCPSATFALQYVGFVRSEDLDLKADVIVAVKSKQPKPVEFTFS